MRGRSKKLRIAFHFARTDGWSKEEYECEGCQRRGDYTLRGCRLYHPKTLEKVRSAWWRPSHTGRKKTVTIDGVACNECPVGLITPASKQMVAALERSHYAGVPMYGGNLAEWPARMVDALVTIEQERNREMNARNRSEMED